MSNYYDTSYPPSLWDGTPAPPALPVVTALVPNTGVQSVSIPNFEVQGTGFISGDVIVTNNTARATTFVSATVLRCSMAPSTLGGWPVLVRRAGQGDSNAMTFTVTAAVEESPEGSATGQARVPVAPDSPQVPQDSLDSPGGTGGASKPPDSPRAG
jgi:hypothetical protein